MLLICEPDSVPTPKGRLDLLFVPYIPIIQSSCVGTITIVSQISSRGRGASGCLPPSLYFYKIPYSQEAMTSRSIFAKNLVPFRFFKNYNKILTLKIAVDYGGSLVNTNVRPNTLTFARD